MVNLCVAPLIEEFKCHNMSVFPLIFNEFKKLISIYSERIDGDDSMQELTVFLIELLYSIDLTRFKLDNSETIQRYIAVSIRNKYIIMSKDSDMRRNFNLQLFEHDIAQWDNYSERDILRSAMELLSEKQRKIIEYKYFRNYSDHQIALLTGISRQAVNRLKNRGLKVMRNYYNGYY